MSPYLTGQFIKEQRKKLGYSQQELSRLLYVEPQTISKWERGLGMPDYDNLEKLKELFGCTLSDILEPPADTVEETLPTPLPQECAHSNLPILLEVVDNGKKDGGAGFSFRRIFSFLNKERIKNSIGRLFGYKYESVYTEKFLFRGLFRKRTREDYETTLTQGMFTDRISHPVLGITAPWLYLRFFFLLLLCAGLGLLCSHISDNPIYAVLFLSALSALPLTLFLFESNFARNVSLLQLLKIFFLGGLLSLLFTFILAPMSSNPVVATIVIAPIFEELAKAIVTVLFLSRIKPKNLLTGLLVGFAVGAGFTVFENLLYAIGTYASYLIYGTEEALYWGSTSLWEGATRASVFTAALRAFCGLFSMHHYWTGIFGALYILFKRDVRFRMSELFSPRVGLSLLFCMLLHFTWNSATLLTEIPFLTYLLSALVGILSVGATVILINVGIAQTKIIDIYESAKGDPAEERSAPAEEPISYEIIP